MSDAPDNVVKLAEAYDKAKKRGRPKKTGGGPPPPPPESPAGGRPGRLPDDSPVKALGTLEGTYYYLDSLVQMRAMPMEKHGRLHILSLFGGTEYLNETWPIWKLEDGEWVKKDNFDHGALAPVLMASCTDKGTWDPRDKVRGPGCWVEDDGTLVMHCGRWLWISSGVVEHIQRNETGLREPLVYERRPALPEPDFMSDTTPGQKLAEQLETWNWKRRDVDPTLVLGWSVCALLGQALPWRPAIWITGGKGRGKSTLIKLLEWLIGSDAMIRPDQASPAYIYQTLGNSCLPVMLDEFEAKQDNAMQQKVIELMRISASGGKVGRGGTTPDAAKTYELRSCFLFGSINMQSLTPQDQSRLAICELLPFDKGVTQAEFEYDAPDETDEVLGSKDSWAKAGRELRARILEQWPRVRKTFRAYRHALLAAGHDKRTAEQFGALGMGADIALYSELDLDRPKEWASKLPPSLLAEALGRDEESDACLKWLLQARVPVLRAGTEPTVAGLLRQARSDMSGDLTGNGPSEALEELLKIGVRLLRGTRELVIDGKVEKEWWICVANTHQALSSIFERSHWRGVAGSPGTWAQALRNIEGAAPQRQMRFGRVRQWVTPVPWIAAFPPYDLQGDEGEIEFVDPVDRDESIRGQKVEF